MAMVEPLRNAAFISVPCRCGRLLRAKTEMVGDQIQCWDCHQMVTVPYPRQPGQVTRALSEGWQFYAQVETVGAIFGATILVVAAMMIPRLGLVAAWVALAAVAVGLLGRTIEQTSWGDRPIDLAEAPRATRAVIVRIGIAALMAAGTLIPLWVMNSALYQSPHLNAVGIALFAATWTVFPIAAMMAFGRGRKGLLGVREGLRVVARHPMMYVMALILVPMSLAMAEVVLACETLWQGSFSFVALDLFPMPDNPVLIDNVPMYNNVGFRSYPTNRFFQGYLVALKQGYSFVGALPPSLSRPTNHGLNSYAISIQPLTYWLCRGFGSALIVGMMLSAATLQAAWLGALTAVDQRRVAS